MRHIELGSDLLPLESRYELRRCLDLCLELRSCLECSQLCLSGAVSAAVVSAAAADATRGCLAAAL